MKNTVHLSKANRERLEKYHSDANCAIEAALNKAEGNISEITIDYAKLAAEIAKHNRSEITKQDIRDACSEAIIEARH